MSSTVKRICLISPFPPPYGGMAIQAEKLAHLLRQAGLDVITVKTNVDLPSCLTFFGKVKGIRTIIRTVIFLTKLDRSLRRDTGVVYFLSGFFGFFFWVTYPALFLIKLRGKRVVLNGRGGGAREFFHKYGVLVKPILKRADAISVPSGFLRDAFKEALNLETTIIPNIADLGQFAYRERCHVTPTFLVTRSLEKIYNVACVIKAFKIVHTAFPDSKLGIAGDGSLRSDLEQLVGELGLEDQVTFYGVVDHAGIQDLYDQYDIYVNASNVDNFPGTILEAFACGLPVVSTNAGGIPYMVTDGVTGFLVEKEDFESLANKMILLVEQPRLSLRLARNARAECSKYSWESVKTKLIPLLEQVTHEPIGV